MRTLATGPAAVIHKNTSDETDVIESFDERLFSILSSFIILLNNYRVCVRTSTSVAEVTKQYVQLP